MIVVAIRRRPTNQDQDQAISPGRHVQATRYKEDKQNKTLVKAVRLSALRLGRGNGGGGRYSVDRSWHWQYWHPPCVLPLALEMATLVDTVALNPLN